MFFVRFLCFAADSSAPSRIKEMCLCLFLDSMRSVLTFFQKGWKKVIFLVFTIILPRNNEQPKSAIFSTFFRVFTEEWWFLGGQNRPFRFVLAVNLGAAIFSKNWQHLWYFQLLNVSDLQCPDVFLWQIIDVFLFVFHVLRLAALSCITRNQILRC